MPDILFYGDPEENWAPLQHAAAETRPDAVVLLGDMGLDVPLDQKLSDVTAAGTSVYWIAGNHDGDDAEQHDRLFESALSAGDLNARVADIQGIRVAGLGGVFRGKIWNPANPDGPRFADRKSYIQCVPKTQRWRGGLPVRHRVTVFPEDVEALKKLRADVLVTHEAPSCHPYGFAVIDDIAWMMGVERVFHGHHHQRYEAQTRDGIPVTGLAIADVCTVSW